MKPRICEVLGVEVGQIFKIKGAQMGFYVDSDGIVRREEDDACTGLPELCFMINLPERMEKKPIWTDQEVQDAKAILRMFGADNFTHVTKDPDGWPSIENLWAYVRHEEGRQFVKISASLLKEHAIETACEAIQVAAVCQRILDREDK